MSLDDVASCFLFSIVRYVWTRVVLPTEERRVLANSDRISEYPLRRQTVENNSQECGFHFKDRVLQLVYKQQACYAVIRYDNTYRRDQKSFLTCKAFVRNIPEAKLLRFFHRDQACTCICTCRWVALSKIFVTTVNTRNIFYYKISEYAICPQYVKLLLTHSIA